MSDQDVAGQLVGVLPAAPPAAATVFGSHLDQITAFGELLAGAGVERGLIGPREAPRLWERHLLNCAGLFELLEDGLAVADLGSGAGLPGLVLAIARPDLTVVLIEALLRRSTFLEQAKEQLGLRNVVVRRSRGEELHGRLEVDVVVARAVAPLDRLAGWALPLLRPGGRLLALKGDRAEDELAVAAPALHKAGATASEVRTVGDRALCTDGKVVVVTRTTGTLPGTKPGRDTSRRR